MKAHKFKIGEYVRVNTAKYLGAPQGRYEVVRLMPPEGNQNQYRVRAVEGGVERMVKEEDLT
jgi:hypothetical protein